MNLVEYEVNSLRFTKNLIIWILFTKQLKINRAKASLKMKIFFWNEITCRVSIKIKIIFNWYVVLIILIKIVWTLSMNLFKSEVNSLKFNENNVIWIQIRKQLKISSTRASLKLKIILWNKIPLRISIKIKISSNGCVNVIILI